MQMSGRITYTEIMNSVVTEEERLTMSRWLLVGGCQRQHKLSGGGVCMFDLGLYASCEGCWYSLAMDGTSEVLYIAPFLLIITFFKKKEEQQHGFG